MTKAAEGYNFDYLLFIGRFNPPTLAHMYVVEQGLKQAKKIIIGIGSTNLSHDIRNPWSFEDRVTMFKNSGHPVIEQAVKDDRLLFIPLDDYKYMLQAWITNVQTQVAKVTEESATIGLIGYAKDGTSYYLNTLPEYTKNGKGVSVTPMHEMSATAIREAFFEDEQTFETLVPEYITPNIHQLLKVYRQTPEYERIKKEHQWAKDYKKLWANTPYAVIFQTVDTVVIRSGHILLIQRKAFPGQGQWALPGGYINPDETLEDAAIRELLEETKLGLLKLDDVPLMAEDVFPTAGRTGNKSKLKNFLKAHIVKAETFDDPHRSLRGRVITRAFLIDLGTGQLPVVKGSDDAAQAKFVPLSELRSDNMFEDHYAIIQALTSNL